MANAGGGEGGYGGACANGVFLYLDQMTDSYCTHQLQILGLSLHWREDSCESTRDAFWDALQRWCDRQNVYPGGNSAQVFLLSNKESLRFRSALTRWLNAQPGLLRFEMAPVTLDVVDEQSTRLGDSPPQSLSMGSHLPAALEALGNYQQHLIEEFQQTVELLPRLCAATHGRGVGLNQLGAMRP